jgi:uncharacterized protein
MDTAIFSLSFVALAFAAILLLKPFDKRLTFYFGALFAVYLALDDLATGLPNLVPVLGFAPSRWNWEGKVYSLLLSVLVIFALRIKPKAIGLTLEQRNLKASLIALAISVPWGISWGLLFKPGLSAETLAFQALMPGLAEELTYRGIAPALLLGLIRGKEPLPGIPWVVVFISAIMFAAWHGLGYSSGSFSFQLVPALLTGIGAIALGWLRFNSGSLLFPFLLHGVANVAFHLTAIGA